MTKTWTRVVITALGALMLGFVAPGDSIAMPPDSYSTKIEKTQYNGWEVYRLTNGLVSMLVAPQLGGRVIQLQLGDQDFFFVNKDLAGKVLPESENNLQSGWANYGGDKVWPAPEGWDNEEEWPSIPYYILDGSTYSSQVVTESPQEVAMRVTSPPDPRSGVQLIRTYHVYAGTTRVQVDEVMRNISRREVRWGLWHLIQNDAADAIDPTKPNPDLYMYIPLNPRSAYEKGYYMPYGDARHPSYERIEDNRILRVHYLYRVGKVAADCSAGWYAVVNGQKKIALVETFPYFPQSDYPDGASVESWNDGAGMISRGPWDQTLADDPKKTPYFLESEGLSPYARLEPGEEYHFTFHWSPTSVHGAILDGANLAGVAGVPFAATRHGSNVRLTGVFGVFVPGTLKAVLYGTLGEILKQETLASVDPRHPVELDKTIAAPANTYRISIYAADGDGENRGFLGNAILLHR
jgi:Domain of unknown function (DUF4380)